MPRVDMSGYARQVKRLGRSGVAKVGRHLTDTEANIAERMFDRLTPVRTGLMRRSWRRRRTKAGVVIENHAKGNSKHGYAWVVFWRKRMPQQLDDTLDPKLPAIVERGYGRAGR